MKKIPTCLVRDPDDRRHVLMEINPSCEWVFAGEGVATRKYDGTCTMLDENGKWWARREIKPGRQSPPNYVLEDHDEITGKSQGWEPMEQSSFIKAFQLVKEVADQPGTYELVGPKINGDPDGWGYHYLMKHSDATIVPGLSDQPITPERAADVILNLSCNGQWEGLVWHHPDGRMGKLKARDIAR